MWQWRNHALTFLNIFNYPDVFQRKRAANILERMLAQIQPSLKYICPLCKDKAD